MEQSKAESNDKFAIIEEINKVASFVSRIKPSTQKLSSFKKIRFKYSIYDCSKLYGDDRYYFAAEGLEQKLADF